MLIILNFKTCFSRRTIGIAKVEHRIYLLKLSLANVESNSRVLILSNHSKRGNQDAISLYHKRLEHSNILYLEKLFPTFNINEIKESFSFETYILSKHSRTSYYSHPYKNHTRLLLYIVMFKDLLEFLI